MRAETFPKFDAAEFLTDNETIGFYLTEALATKDAKMIAIALGDGARAKGGITHLSRKTGITREALHRALSKNGNPEFGTVLKVMEALGVRLKASIVAKRKAA